jgi:hypothetical protein
MREESVRRKRRKGAVKDSPLCPDALYESRYGDVEWPDENEGRSGGGRLKATGRRLGVFLRAFARTGHGVSAAKAAGLSYGAVAEARRRLPEFDRAFLELRELQVDLAEEELFRRAQGWNEDVIYRGAKVGESFRYSDQCLIHLLKSRRPEIYGDRARVDHVSSDGSMTPAVVRRPDDETVRELNAMFTRLLEAAGGEVPDDSGPRH